MSLKNPALYNAALAGIVSGSLAGRSHPSAPAGPYAAECAAAATALDTAVAAVPSGITPQQASLMQEICDGLWHGRTPHSTDSTDGGYVATAAIAASIYASQAANLSNSPNAGSSQNYQAKTVCLVNVANLASYTVAASATFNDNVAVVEGDIILLSAQTTPAQNGPYVVGAVTTGHAALTRPSWWATGLVFQTGVQIRLSGFGLVFANTTWQAMKTALTFTVGTDDPTFYPLVVCGTAQLVSGTVDLALPIKSTKTGVALSRITPSGSANTIMYAVNGAPTPGAGAAGVVHLFATIAAGTINAADGSTLLWTVTNQPA